MNACYVTQKEPWISIHSEVLVKAGRPAKNNKWLIGATKWAHCWFMSKAPAAFFRVRDNFGLSDPIRILFKQCVNGPHTHTHTRTHTHARLLCHYIISTSSLPQFYYLLNSSAKLQWIYFTFHRMADKFKEKFKVSCFKSKHFNSEKQQLNLS